MFHFVQDCNEVPFTGVRTNFCTDKNLHGSTLRLHGNGGTGRLSVQVKKQQPEKQQLFGRTDKRNKQKQITDMR